MVTRGPPACVCALRDDAGAAEPGLRRTDRVGDDPVGQQLQEAFFEARENSAAVLASRNSEDRSRSSMLRSRTSSSGRPIASPVKNNRFDLVLLNGVPYVFGVEFRRQNHCRAGEQRHPGRRLGGAVDHRRDREANHRGPGDGELGMLVLVLYLFAGGEVGAPNRTR